MNIYKIIDVKTNKTKFEGTYDECRKHQTERIVFSHSKKPIYRVINNNGILGEGTLDELCRKLDLFPSTLHNYTFEPRKKDGLFMERIDDE